MTCVTGLVVVMLVNRTDWCILTGARRCTLTASCRWYGRSDSSWMSELKCVCLIQLIGRTAWLFNCIVFDCSVWLIEYTGTVWLNDHDWLMLWIKLWLVRSYSYVNGELLYNLLDGQVHMKTIISSLCFTQYSNTLILNNWTRAQFMYMTRANTTLNQTCSIETAKHWQVRKQ